MENNDLKTKVLDYIKEKKFFLLSELQGDLSLDDKVFNEVVTWLKRDYIIYSVRENTYYYAYKNEDRTPINNEEEIIKYQVMFKIIKSLKDKYRVSELRNGTYNPRDHYFFSVKEMDLNRGRYIFFRLFNIDGVYYLGDNAIASSVLNRYGRNPNNKIAKDIMAKIAKKHHAFMNYDEVRIEITNVDDAPSYLEELYETIKDIFYNLDDYLLIHYVKAFKIKNKSRAILRQIVNNNGIGLDEDNEPRITKNYAALDTWNMLMDALRNENFSLAYEYIEVLHFLREINGDDFNDLSYLLYYIEERKEEKIFKNYISTKDDEVLRHILDDNSTCATIIEDTLKSFNIDAKVYGVMVGDFITRYNIKLDSDIALETLYECKEALANNLDIPNKIRIYRDLETNDIALEVSNYIKSIVTKYFIKDYKGDKVLTFPFVLGNDAKRETIYADLNEMEHIFIAGSSKSGKTIFLKSTIKSLMSLYSPKTLKLIIVDPKAYEFNEFKNEKYLALSLIHNIKLTLEAFDAVIKEMENRYKYFNELSKDRKNINNIIEYNKTCIDINDYLSNIVIIIDGLELILSHDSKNEVKESILLLASKGSKVGIHMILATGNLHSKYLPNDIIDSIPTHIAFRLNSEDESISFLNELGAESLLGEGDMLLKTKKTPKSIRIQGVYIR